MIKLAIFDMDGTVFESFLDWRSIKKELGIKSNILAEIYKDGKVDFARLEKLERYEEANTLKTQPIAGVSEYLHFLDKCSIRTALVTNNNKMNTDYLLNKFGLKFGTVVTREQKFWKPDPGAFFHVMDKYGCDVSSTFTIGDSHYDVKASQAAGIKNIYIINGESAFLSDLEGFSYFDDYFHLQEISRKSLNLSVS
ncbi:MAG: HAD-IA family hydrolase [bacterium]|nr:HAD-IA family hydrolase [bacterium]